jgi:hypothetical protein
MRIISDKHGEKYKVVIYDEKYSLNFKVFTTNPMIQEACVGYANCLHEGKGILMLADIFFKEDMILVYRRTGLFWMFQKVKRERKNFQRIGLGTGLLKCVFAVAMENGINLIDGKIKGIDYPKNEKLPKWYADMGFTVTMETKPSAIVARISKEL